MTSECRVGVEPVEEKSNVRTKVHLDASVEKTKKTQIGASWQFNLLICASHAVGLLAFKILAIQNGFWLHKANFWNVYSTTSRPGSIREFFGGPLHDMVRILVQSAGWFGKWQRSQRHYLHTYWIRTKAWLQQEGATTDRIEPWGGFGAAQTGEKLHPSLLQDLQARRIPT